jgi:RNA polymerase sigma-70 factor (ECF subfamily)
LRAKDIQAVSQRLHLGSQRPKPGQRQTGLDHNVKFVIDRKIQGSQHYGLMMSDSPGVSKKMLHQSVTPPVAGANDPQMQCSAQDNVVPRQSFADLDRWMERYQQADPEAPAVLVGAISPALLRFFRSQVASREQADDLLQETWLRIHRVRHTYRPGEPVLPWIYAIARRVRVDGYRRTRRITLHEIAMELLPERPAPVRDRNLGPAFDTLVAALPEAQREVVTMLKVGGLTLEEVARATSSTVGAVKQKAHRAYERLRDLLQSGEGAKGAAQ